MEKKDVNARNYYTIDLLHILRFLWQKAWVIILAALIAGGVGFGISAFLIKPTYSSTILLYVNNNSISLGGNSISISSSEISAAQSLVKTYGRFLHNRTTYQKIIDKAGVKYTPDELEKMIKSGSSNDTEVMYVTVTANDPYEAALIANSVAEILPERITEILENKASMKIVDSAEPDLEKVGPSITKYTAVGILIGVLGSVAVLAITAITDDRIHDEDYIIQTYEYPILAKIPNLVDANKKGGYGRYGKYKYYYYSKEYEQSAYEKDSTESNDESTVAADDSAES